MIKRIISSQSKTITGAAIIIGVASFISRIIGVIRDRVFAHTFGAGTMLDAYYAAFRIPDLIYNLLIVGALSAGFIPIFTKLYAKDTEDAWRLTSRVINIIAVTMTVVMIVIWFSAPILTALVVPGFDSDALDMTITLTRIMLFSPIILGVSSVLSGTLQSLKSFFVYSLTPIMYNLGIIFGALVLNPIYGIRGLAYGVILGTSLHLAIQIPSMIHHGYRHKAVISFRDPQVIRILRLMLPRTLGLATAQVNLLVITILASTISIGSVTIFNLANNLQYFPIGIVGVSYAIAAFPTLASLAARADLTKLRARISETARQIFFLIIPLTIVFLLLRSQIVRVILGSGAFDWNATITTANTLAFFTFSMFAQALIPLLVRAFFALEDTRTPLYIGLIAAITTIMSAYILKDHFGVSGLALGFSIGSSLQFALLWFFLRQRAGSLHEFRSLHLLYKVSIAGIVMGVTIQLIKLPIAMIVDMDRFWGVLTQAIIAGGLGLVTYAGICSLLELEELIRLRDSFERRFLRIKRVQGEIKGSDIAS